MTTYYTIMYWETEGDEEIAAYTTKPQTVLDKLAQLMARDVDQLSLFTMPHFPPVDAVNLDALPPASAHRHAETA